MPGAAKAEPASEPASRRSPRRRAWCSTSVIANTGNAFAKGTGVIAVDDTKHQRPVHDRDVRVAHLDHVSRAVDAHGRAGRSQRQREAHLRRACDHVERDGQHRGRAAAQSAERALHETEPSAPAPRGRRRAAWTPARSSAGAAAALACVAGAVLLRRRAAGSGAHALSAGRLRTLREVDMRRWVRALPVILAAVLAVRCAATDRDRRVERGASRAASAARRPPVAGGPAASGVDVAVDPGASVARSFVLANRSAAAPRSRFGSRAVDATAGPPEHGALRVVGVNGLDGKLAHAVRRRRDARTRATAARSRSRSRRRPTPTPGDVIAGVVATIDQAAPRVRRPDRGAGERSSTLPVAIKRQRRGDRVGEHRRA